MAKNNRNSEKVAEVLILLKENPKSAAEIASAANFENRMKCAGTLAQLMRVKAIEIEEPQYRITEIGLRMLEQRQEQAPPNDELQMTEHHEETNGTETERSEPKQGKPKKRRSRKAEVAA